MEAVLRLLWQLRIEGLVIASTDGLQQVVVHSGGEFDPATGSYRTAEIELNGVRMRGDVLFGERHTLEELKYAVLQVVEKPAPLLSDYNGRTVVQIVLGVPEALAQSVQNLLAGAARYECGDFIAGLDPVVRVKLLDDLLLERLRRKCNDIRRIFETSEWNWGQTFYVMFFRTMGGNRNREPYMKLAQLATYRMTLAERANPMMVEALLLGASGLLDGCYYDEYIHQLRDHFTYLANKYRITPMAAGEWERGGINPAGSPIIRIAQLASFVASQDFVLDRMLACRTREDVHTLFNAEVSDYWATHYQPDTRTGYSIKRIGESKADLLGINLVVPMMMAYADATKKEPLKEAALSLLEQIPAENNAIIRSWSGAGVPVTSAFDSQALLQLRTEYCEKQLCTQCRVGKRMLRRVIYPQ